MRNELTGDWECYPFEFGPVGQGKSLKLLLSEALANFVSQIVEDNERHDLAPEHLQQLGTITIFGYQVTKTRLKKPYVSDGVRPKAVKGLPEHMLKSKDVKHNMT